MTKTPFIFVLIMATAVALSALVAQERKSTPPSAAPATAPSTAPATQPTSLHIVFMKTGGFAGVHQIQIFQTAGASDDHGPEVTTLSPQQASQIIDLLAREKFTTWPTHDSGSGTWNDNFHYDLDVTIGKESHGAHVPEGDKTRSEVERLLRVVEQIRKIAGK